MGSWKSAIGKGVGRVSDEGMCPSSISQSAHCDSCSEWTDCTAGAEVSDNPDIYGGGKASDSQTLPSVSGVGVGVF